MVKENMKFELDEKTQVKLNELNEKVNTVAGYSANDILQSVRSLQQTGEVIVGWRSSCGVTDRTQKMYSVWKKAIIVLEKAGIKLSQENLKVGNSYATNKGGFWHEIKYSLIQEKV
jgi:hypothetical protein